MTKIIVHIIILFMLTGVISTNVFAANIGDVTGYLYSTDIIAYVDGLPINSYNTDGKTGIICEELRDYGFEVTWSENTRELFVTTKSERPVASEHMISPKDGKAGEVVGNIYYTDIITYVNGKRIPSYSIDGRTILLLEDLNDAYGFSTQWDETSRTIKMNPYRPGQYIDADLGQFTISGFEMASAYKFDIYNGCLTLDDKTVAVDGDIILANFQEYVPLKSTLDALDIPYEWNYENNTLKISYTPASMALKGDRIPNDSKVLDQSEDPLLKINMKVEINNTQYPIIGSAKGILVPTRLTETPVVYKGTVYFPADALADYFDLVYKRKGRYMTKKDDPETWYAVSRYVMMPVGESGELKDWIEYTKPENYSSGRGGPIISPYGQKEPIKIKFVRSMDSSIINSTHIPIVRRYYSEEDQDYKYEVISDKYDYVYDEENNILTITFIGDGLSQGEEVSVFLKNIADSNGNRMDNIYQFLFWVDKT